MGFQEMTRYTGQTWAPTESLDPVEIRPGERTSSQVVLDALKDLQWTGLQVCPSLFLQHFFAFPSSLDVVGLIVSLLVQGLCCFASKGNIYWTDHGLNLIEVARSNGMYRAVVISDGLDQPRAIAVHPVKGYVLHCGLFSSTAKLQFYPSVATAFKRMTYDHLENSQLVQLAPQSLLTADVRPP